MQYFSLISKIKVQGHQHGFKLTSYVRAGINETTSPHFLDFSKYISSKIRIGMELFSLDLIVNDPLVVSLIFGVHNRGTQPPFKCYFLVSLLCREGLEATVTNPHLEYTCILLESYCHQMNSCKEYKGWKKSSTDSCQKVAKAILHDLLFDNASFKEVWEEAFPSKEIAFDSVERWYFGHTILSRIQKEVLKSCFKYDSVELTVMIPQPTQLPKFIIISIKPRLILINSAFKYAFHKPRTLFSALLFPIVNKGPTLIVVEDQSGNKFGGFASASWEVRPQFHGTPECFLFALQPQAGVFHSTGYNNNFMYLNYLEKNTMPNGLGMGGREELFGLWLDYDFGVGKVAPTCTTFRSPPISPNQDLDIKNLEVWALGEEEVDSDEEEGNRKSALDRNPEARAMLDMMGKAAHSDGYREEEE
ncbi:unnamed protein product, partial [Meganyctiphanes norvegica]